MVVLNKIYTKTGDAGDTALGTGERRPKHDLRIAAYGTVDEANAAIGIARLHLPGDIAEMMGRIQNDLFDLGADLCMPAPTDGKPLPYEPLRMTTEQVERLESEIDRLNAFLAPLNSFVLPGGSAGSAHLHLARAIVRRAERLMVELDRGGEKVSPAALAYINRLSDFLFVAARFVNDKGGKDVLWVPGANR
jgi:cob(I)alamin adenosyltransferase